EFSTNVAIPAAVGGNLPPTASFTDTCNGLVCKFDGSGSTDPDGHVVSYAWDFGDTHTDTVEAPQHSFTTPGMYTVTLTVTDDGGDTGTTSAQITVVDLPPTAAFTGNCTGTSCNFDASTSTDPDNSIASYSWDFGDTLTGSGETTAHAYAVTGNYTVTLTVDDGEGGTSSVSHVFDAGTTTNTVVASDTFTRTVASGWGNADTGGAYTAAPGSVGAAVNGTAGTFKLAKAATGGGEYLSNVSALDSDALVNIATNVAPAGGTWGQVGYLTARRVAANTEYRARLRFTPSHTLRVSFVKVVGNTTEVMIGSEVLVSGVPYVAGRAYSLRFDVTGTAPTTLQAKVWVAGTTEPAKWTLTASDSEPALQAAGSPGTRVFLGGSATSFPTWSFDNLSVATLP
ncbi:MAG TPA: PKD domain-containing protein, partial [Acidimicrobiia bacterium]